MSRPLTVGSRGSPLARAQTKEVIDRLRTLRPGLALETVVIRTHGDEGVPEDLGAALDGKRAFTKRIDDALLGGTVDVAIHSLKDVPTDLVPGLVLAAVPPRADPSDVLVCADGTSFRDLPRGTRVGTSSLRRKAQILAHSSDLEVVDLRGNVGTRLRRLDAHDVDAVVMAAAGLQRLGVQGRSPETISPEILTPAPGQGALAVECRAEDSETQALLGSIDHLTSRRAVEAERALSARMGGGCNIPFGALATVEDDGMVLRAVVASVDGRQVIRASARGLADAPIPLADTVYRSLVDRGGQAILKVGAG